jgi:uncharacterized protein (TIGR03435 family)
VRGRIAQWIQRKICEEFPVTENVGPLSRRGTWMLLLLAGILTAQTAPDGQFEVISIRRSAESGRPAMEFTPGGGARATNVTLKMLIEMAYDIRPEQLSGGPGWADSEQYTVIAKGPDSGPILSETSQHELTRKRLRALLGDRFHLALKIDAVTATGYVLRIEKKGHKMTLADDAATRQLRQVGRWQLRAEAVDMQLLARFLSVHMRGTLEDRTGLEGRYNFYLDWTPSPLPSSIASLDGLPKDSLIPALEEQLGLRLERQKVATDRFTIEHVEKPTEN